MLKRKIITVLTSRDKIFNFLNYISEFWKFFRTGRTALHIAILKEREEIVQYLATKINQTLHIGDNVNIHFILFLNENVISLIFPIVGTYGTSLCDGCQQC